MPQQQPMIRQDEGDDDEFDDRGGQQGYDRPMQQGGDNRQQSYGQNDPQPYVNGGQFNGHREMPVQGAPVMDADEGNEGEEGGFVDDNGEHFAGLERTLGFDRGGGGGERQPQNDRPQNDRPQGDRPQGGERFAQGGEGGGGGEGQYRSRRPRRRPRREGEFNQNQPQQPRVPVTEE
jgi:hypothetical protein